MCKQGFEINNNQCLKIQEQQNPEEPTHNQSPQPGLEITDKIFKPSPSRIELTFNKKITSLLNNTNIRILIQPNNNHNENINNNVRPIEVQPTLILHQEGSQLLKILFRIKDMVENGILTLNLKDTPIFVIDDNNENQDATESTLTTKDIRIEGVNNYYPSGEVGLVEDSSKGISAGVLILLLITLLDSTTALFDFIKFGQMLGFLALLNFEHPTNLEALLEFLRMNFLDVVPRFSSKIQNDICMVYKDKFVDEGFSCYILMDQGRYFILALAFFLLLVLLKAVNLIKRCKFIEKNLINNMRMKFWNHYFEVIRLDIFISVSLTMSKLLVLINTKKKKAWLGINFSFSFLVSFYYVFLLLHQFHRIKKFHEKEKNKKKLVKKNPKKRWIKKVKEVTKTISRGPPTVVSAPTSD